METNNKKKTEVFFKIREMLLLQKTVPADMNSHMCPKAQVFASTQSLR